jgi:hypothetical protein
MRQLTADEIKTVKEKLKECKPEWLEKNAKGQDSLGVWTVQQILDYATEGITTWDFIPQKEWREEVHKYDKNTRQWMFDGYVYHVRGTLIIHGIGRRSQYGSKVAVGGKDNQNSSYKSAASDCLKKCASLFGVGSSIYSKIKIDFDDQDQAYGQLQNDPNYHIGSMQMSMPQAHQTTYPNGLVQQGEWIWDQSRNQWVHQNEYYGQQQFPQPQHGGYPSQPLTPQQQNQWYEQTMQAYDPQGYQQMMQQTSSEEQKMQEAIAFADQQVNNANLNFPFENVPPKQEQPQAQPQEFQATPQAEVKQQEFQAIQYGAPVEPKAEPSAAAPKKEEDPLAHVVPNNPWDTPENQEQIAIFRQHKERLGIKQDSQLLPYVRDFFKDGNATIASITPDTLKGFNAYLENIQV